MSLYWGCPAFDWLRFDVILIFNEFSLLATLLWITLCHIGMFAYSQSSIRMHGGYVGIQKRRVNLIFMRVHFHVSLCIESDGSSNPRWNSKLWLVGSLGELFHSTPTHMNGAHKAQHVVKSTHWIFTFTDWMPSHVYKFTFYSNTMPIVTMARMLMITSVNHTFIFTLLSALKDVVYIFVAYIVWCKMLLKCSTIV